MGPICKFADSKHARELMTEWKERLALHQWAIKLNLCDPHEFIMSNVADEIRPQHTFNVKEKPPEQLKGWWTRDELEDKGYSLWEIDQIMLDMKSWRR